MSLSSGTRLGSYEIVGLLGAGGMGEVYRARDTKLDRHVAIKILPESFAGDPDRLRRFEREAKTLAALNHPHIAQIHGFEQSTGVSALVIELVEGDDLAARSARGPIPIDEALPMARQIAEALEAAHEQGIIHRDLKPANIKIRADGSVKVLDFGLAKAFVPADGPASAATLTSPAAATIGGMIIGTAAYMSPEQAKGKPVDKRADIWAFGVVLLEMLSGQRAFAGDNVSETLAAVLRDQPPLGALPDATPAPVRDLIARCLDRDPLTRLRDIGEARVVLSRGAVRGESVASARTAGGWRLWAGLAAGVAIGAAAAMFVVWRPVVTPALVVRKFPITVDGLDLTPNQVPAISPDGRHIVYSANGSLYLRDLTRVEAQALPETLGASGLFWSPDSTRIGFIRSGRLWTMPITGGGATSVAVLPGTPCGEVSGHWQPSGRILFSLSCSSFPLFSVSAAGGDLVTALVAEKPAERDFHQIAALPGDRGVVLTVDRANEGDDTLITWDGTRRKMLLQLPKERIKWPVYSPSGHLLYQRTTNNPGVWAVPFSVNRLEVTGEPFLVAAGMGAPSISRDGTLLVMPITATGDNQLVWADRTGRVDVRIGETSPRMQEPRLSPDGRRVAFSITGTEGGRNIVVLNLADGTRTPITSGPVLKWHPIWSPDGQYVYYEVEQPGRPRRIERQPSAGGGKPDTIGEGVDGAISANGQWLVYVSTHGSSGRKLMKMRLDGDRKPALLFDTAGRPEEPVLSPDQRFLAYVIGSTPAEDGIYVRRFPNGEGQWQLDAARGEHPRWSAKGDRLYFARGNELWEIEVTLGDSPVFSRAARVFAGYENRVWPTPYGYDVAADGRFLLVGSVARSAAPVMTLIENWYAEFATRK